VPTIDLTDAERAEVTALIKRAIEEDRFRQSDAITFNEGACVESGFRGG
jgi:hypothetical protein